MGTLELFFVFNDRANIHVRIYVRVHKHTYTHVYVCFYLLGTHFTLGAKFAYFKWKKTKWFLMHNKLDVASAAV